jgi:hypothetical protein
LSGAPAHGFYHQYRSRKYWSQKAPHGNE